MIDVATGVILNSQKEVLIALRPPHVHLGNLWEFPGGKINFGESVADALAREMDEELGITVISSKPLISVVHHYQEMTVRLNVHLIEKFQGEPIGKEGQSIQWVLLPALDHISMPPASLKIVKMIQTTFK